MYINPWTIIWMVSSARATPKFQQSCLIMIVGFQAQIRYMYWLMGSRLLAIPVMAGTIVILIVTPISSNAAGTLIAFYCTQSFNAEDNMITHCWSEQEKASR